MHFKIAKSAQSYFNNIVNLEGSHAAEDKNKFIQFDVYYCCALIGMAAGQIDEDTSELKDLVKSTQFNIVTVKHKLLGYWWHLRPEDSASIRRALSWSRLCYSILATMILCCLRMELKPLTPMR